MLSKKNFFTDDPNIKRPVVITGGSDSILALMFSNIIHDTKVSLMKWNMLMNNHINDPRNSIPNNKRDQSSERGNLQKELLTERMTWKVFCKGMRLLNYGRFKISIEIYPDDPEDEITIHEINVNLGSSLMSQAKVDK